MKYKRSRYNGFLLACVAGLLGVSGCQRQMDEHGRIRPLQEDAFFSDLGSARQQVKGTVSRENVKDATPFYTGRGTGGGYAQAYPLPVDEGLLLAGQEQYRIYCSVCHGAQGAGDGMVVRRGFTKPVPFESPALMTAAPGYLFVVMTDGFKTMDTYADLIDEKNRWAIAAYIKNTLQNAVAAGQQ